VRKPAKLPAAWENLGPKEIRRVGVVGAGTMGAGIAQLAALKGCEVIVQEATKMLWALVCWASQAFPEAANAA